MSDMIGKIIAASLENILQSTNIPLMAADELKDEELRRVLGSFCALICGEIDYKISPLLYKKFPNIEKKKNSS